MSKTYPCERCNMDEGSPLCLQDSRCPSRNTSATTSTFMQQFDDCRDLIGRMEAAMDSVKPSEWVLIAPDGRVWKGNQREVARALLLRVDFAELFPSPTPK